MFIGLSILLSPVNTSFDSVVIPNETIEYVYVIKKGDTKISLQNQFCYLGYVEKIKPGNKIIFRYQKKYLQTIYYNYIAYYNNNQFIELGNKLLDQSVAFQTPPCLTLAIVATESSFNTETQSHRHSFGIMQVHKIHFKQYGVDFKSIMNHDINIPIGMSILKDKQNKYNRPDWYIAYNTGSKFKINQCNKIDDREICKDVAKEYKSIVDLKMKEIFKINRLK